MYTYLYQILNTGPIKCVHVVSSMLWYPLRFPRKTMFGYLALLYFGEGVIIQCFIYVICIYLRKLESNTIPISNSSPSLWESCCSIFVTFCSFSFGNCVLSFFALRIWLLVWHLHVFYTLSDRSVYILCMLVVILLITFSIVSRVLLVRSNVNYGRYRQNSVIQKYEAFLLTWQYDILHGHVAKINSRMEVNQCPVLRFSYFLHVKEPNLQSNRGGQIFE